jgi:hypothetical protein
MWAKESRRHGGAKGSGSCGAPSTVTVIVPSSATVITTCGSTTGTARLSGSLGSGAGGVRL